MSTRRQEKVARIVKEMVSDAIANHLNDPRIEGFVSVTRVDMGPDLRSADVYLSVFERGFSSAQTGKVESDTGASQSKKTFAAILHAKRRIQSLLARKWQSKFCPILRFHADDNFKKALETIRLIDRAAAEIRDRDSDEPDAIESS
ncbi:MAG: ribosome-binding factor A [Planctomycetota bacterium]